MSFTTLKKLLLGLAGALTIASIAPAAYAQEEGDPLEGFNRAMFGFNRAADSYLIRPIAVGYRYITPRVVRTHIGNASDNLFEPVNMVNSLLQGDVTQGMTSFWRFVINTTIGIGGLNDVATEAGLQYRGEDFGQTLAVWGVGTGPYLVLPILGPSNLRDAGGRVADIFTNPINYYVDTDVTVGIAIGQGLILRERFLDPIDEAYASSLDPYSSFRSIYEQRRKAQISNRYRDAAPSIQ